MEQIDISVIIPLYIGKQYCYRLLEMLKENLMYKDLYKDVRLEVIFINDYPEEKITILGDDFFRVILIEHEKNLGIHASRIEGVHRAVGHYIIMLDQDDLVRENWLYSQWHKIENSNTDYCICNGWVDRFHLIWENDIEFDKKVNDLNYYIQVNPIMSPGQVIIKRESIPTEWRENVIKNNGADDYMLWVMALKRGYSFVVNEACLFYHTPERTRNSVDDKKMLESLREVKKILISSGVLNELAFQKAHVNIIEIFEKRAMQSLDEKDYMLWRMQKKEQIFRNWLELKLKNVELARYFKESGIQEIAIYGMGDIGRLFYQEISMSGLLVKYGIDKSAKDYERKLNIYRIEDDLPEVDAVIVTLVKIPEKLLEKLHSKVSHVLYLYTIIEELKEQEYISKLENSKNL